MLADPGSLALLLLFGGWVAVDGATAGQLMISRPLVAATVAGGLMGSPVAGATLGVILEAFQLMVLPVGAARYPEGGPAAVVAGAGYAWAEPSSGLLLTALVFYLAWEWVGGESVRGVRRINGRLLAGVAAAADPGRALERRHWLALGLDFGRGILLVALGLLAFHAVRLVSTAAEIDPGVAGLAATAAVTAMLTGSLRLFGPRVRWFVAGVATGLLLLLVRT